MAVTRADGVHFDAKMAGVDLTSAVGLVCKTDTDGRMVLTTGTGDWPAGVITEGAKADYPVTFQHDGLCKAICNDAIAVGTKVSAGANGRIVAGAGTIFGIARSATAVAGEVIEVQIDRN
jgi:hypothetical protein